MRGPTACHTRTNNWCPAVPLTLNVKYHCKAEFIRPIAQDVENALLESTVPIKIAIMGCVVNGPGEAREADIGIAGGDGFGILFKKGKVIKKFPQARLVEELLKAVDEIEKQG